MNLRRNELADRLYLIGLLVLVTGLPLSMFLMSIGQIILLVSWVIAGNLIAKLKSFFTNPVTILLSLFFFIHLIGFAWSTDWAYAYKDSRIKFPLLLLPLVISTSRELPVIQFRLVLKVFISSVVMGSLVSMAVLVGLIDRPVNDIRDISLFISHIRFGLLICIAVYCAAWLLLTENRKGSLIQHLIMIVILIWLVVFMVILEAMTGLMVLMAASFLVGCWLLFRTPNMFLKSFLLAPLIVSGILVYQVSRISKEVSFTDKTDLARLDSLSSLGNPYSRDLPYDDTENGHPIWTYICKHEIDSVWPTKSNMDISGKDLKGQQLYYTLLRYLASRDLRKDANGINSLRREDIQAVENGFTNYRFTGTSNVYARLYQVVWEYHHYIKHGNPEGHSVMQRLEFWKTGMAIFREHPFLGVGTGDVQLAFNRQYEIMNSPLPKEWRLRAHNQYLTIALTFGTAGLLLFLCSLLFPYTKTENRRNILYSLFLLTALMSFLNEDTLETQAGATFFAFFNAFFLFANSKQNPE